MKSQEHLVLGLIVSGFVAFITFFQVIGSVYDPDWQHPGFLGPIIKATAGFFIAFFLVAILPLLIKGKNQLKRLKTTIQFGS